MAATIAFQLEAPYPLLNQLLRMHFRDRKRCQRHLMLEIAAATRGQRPAKPFQRAKVRIERHSVGTPDLDGLYGGAKGLIDCLTTSVTLRSRTVFGKPRVKNPMGLGFVVDDGPQHIELEVVHVPARRAEQRTLVTISELSPIERTPT